MNKTPLSVIIPAHNEEKTIEKVVEVAMSHPLVSEVIVVDDGSTDNTAQAARNIGADVISLPENLGKASALSAGVNKAENEFLFFIDADVTGLTHEIMDAAITPVAQGRYDMFIAVVERDEKVLEKIPEELHLLGGTRVLSKRVWNNVPPQYRKGFQIEIALNYFVEHSGGKIGKTIFPTFNHIKKEEKRGFSKGFWERLKMIAEITKIVALLYIFHKSFSWVTSLIKTKPDIDF